MANETYYNSALTGDQIEAILTGVRSVQGIVKRVNETTYEAAESGTDFPFPPLSGAGAPSTSTAGSVGQLYFNTTAHKIYRCDAVSGSTYTWNAYS